MLEKDAVLMTPDVHTRVVCGFRGNGERRDYFNPGISLREIAQLIFCLL